MEKKKIGVFGGTFSPPHKGHVRVAEIFADFMKLDKLNIIPAFIPPHKELKSEATPNQRLEMCKIAFGGLDIAEISDIEIKRGGKSFTYLTLEELSSDDVELYMLVGTDMFLTLDMWRCPEKIFSLCKICYVRREDNSELSKKIEEKTIVYKEKFCGEIYRIPNEVLDISSTELRQIISSGYDSSEYLADEVIQYIKQEGLYC